MIILQADPTLAATEAVKALEKGELSQVLQQVTTLCIEAGKSILLAILIFVVGRYLIKFINKMISINILTSFNNFFFSKFLFF